MHRHHQLVIRAFCILVLLATPSIASADYVLTQVNHVATGYDGGGVPLMIPAIDLASCAYHLPSGRLFLADSEINEVAPVWDLVGANIFEVSSDGDSLLATYDLTALGNSEPTGLVYNAFDGHFYSSNDDTRKVYRYSFTDGVGFALDAEVSTMDVSATDPEGITCDPATGTLYVVDGTADWILVYHFDDALPTPAFVLDGVLDLAALNDANQVPTDPEGISFHEPSGELFIISDPDLTVYEFTTSGAYVAEHSLAGLTPVPVAPQGLSFGVSSSASGVPGGLSLYVADGGIDNDQDPAERDGAFYELLVTELVPNDAPMFDPISNGAVDEGVLFTTTAVAHDPDGPDGEIRYALHSGPTGVTVDELSGQVNWTPTEAQGPSSYVITLSASDQALPPATGFVSFTVDVAETNQAPALEPLDPFNVAYGSPLIFTAAASDPDLAPGGLADGLLAYWPVDSDFTSTTGQYDGTSMGGAAITNGAGSFMLGGGALLLDGADDYMDFGELALTGDFTLTAWVNPDNIALGSASRAIVFGDLLNANWLRIESDMVRAKWNNVTITYTTSPSFVNGQWQHFALVRSGTAVTIYRNGVQVGSGSHSETFTPSNLGLKTPNTNYYGGGMDDVAAWNQALTPADIAALYDAGAGRTVASAAVVPANALMFSLEGTVPSGASIDPLSGEFSWTPDSTQGPATWNFDIRVTDDGIPSYSDVTPVEVDVVDPSVLPPVLNPIMDQVIDEETALALTATVEGSGSSSLATGLLRYWPFDGSYTDEIAAATGIPVGDTFLDTNTSKLGTAALSLDGVGDYVDIGDLPLSGDFSISIWVLPTSIQSGTAGGANGMLLGDSANTDWLRLQLEGITAKWSGTTVFTATSPSFVNGQWQHFVLVRESNAVTVYRNNVVACSFTHTADFIPEYIGLKTSGGNYYQGHLDDLAIWVRGLTATEIDELYNGGNGTPIDVGGAEDVIFSLTGSVPNGASIDGVTGAIDWIPSEAQGPDNYDITVRAERSGAPALFDEETFSVQVLEVNLPPQLTFVADAAVDEGDVLAVNLMATDPDLPSNSLGYSLAGVQVEGLSLDPLSGLLQYAPPEDVGQGELTLSVRVTDGGTPQLSTQQSFVVTVNETNSAPNITPTPDQQVVAESLLELDLVGSDPDRSQGLRAGLVAHWPFETDFGSTTGAHDGVSHNGALVTNTPGEYWVGTGAMDLDGVDDYLEFGEISFIGDFSVSAWVRPENVDSLTASSAIVLGDSGNQDWFRLELDGVRAKWDNVTTVMSADPSFVNGTWQHLVLTRRSGVLDVYRDGLLMTSVALPQSFSPEYLGLKTPNTNHYQGQMDEVALWTRSLSETEIAELYNGGSGVALAAEEAPTIDAVQWSLVDPVPAGASLDPSSGHFSWVPDLAQAGQVYSVMARLMDDGVPALSDVDTFDVVVQWPGEPPICYLRIEDLDFGTVEVGDSACVDLLLRNDGGGLLIGEVSCADEALILEAGAGSYSLAAGDSLLITACFSPEVEGPYSGEILLGSVCSGVPWTGEGVVGTDAPARRLTNHLAQNIPNPFNPRTTIEYTLARASHVELVIYDTAGRKVRTLVDEAMGVGDHHIEWSGKDDAGAQVASGVYLYQLRAGDFVETRRMLLLK